MDIKDIPLAHIVCQSSNGVIGNMNNQIPWRCSEDLKFFKSITKHSIVIMGFNTFRSIMGNPIDEELVLSREPVLPNRINIVVCDPTRNEYPKDNLDDYPALDTYVDSNYPKEVYDSGESFKGFTVYVSSFKGAMYSLERYTNYIQKLIDSKRMGYDWAPNDDYLAYVIGGAKLYSDSLRDYNINTIFRNTLPIKVDTRDSVLYPEINGRNFVRVVKEVNQWDIRVGNINFPRAQIQLEKFKKIIR